jgi:hypothetical protein
MPILAGVLWRVIVVSVTSATQARIITLARVGEGIVQVLMIVVHASAFPRVPWAFLAFVIVDFSQARQEQELARTLQLCKILAIVNSILPLFNTNYFLYETVRQRFERLAIQPLV